MDRKRAEEVLEELYPTPLLARMLQNAKPSIEVPRHALVDNLTKAMTEYAQEHPEETILFCSPSDLNDKTPGMEKW